MRRFRVTGPDMLVSGKNAQRLSQTILVKKGQIAVLADDDTRADDLAKNPRFQEVDENGNDIDSLVSETLPADASKGESETDGSGDDTGIHQADTADADETASKELNSEVPATRRRKSADSGGV